jgi:hypothetical protein
MARKSGSRRYSRSASKDVEQAMHKPEARNAEERQERERRDGEE